MACVYTDHHVFCALAGATIDPHSLTERTSVTLMMVIIMMMICGCVLLVCTHSAAAPIATKGFGTIGATHHPSQFSVTVIATNATVEELLAATSGSSCGGGQLLTIVARTAPPQRCTPKHSPHWLHIPDAEVAARMSALVAVVDTTVSALAPLLPQRPNPLRCVSLFLYLTEVTNPSTACVQ